MPVSFSAAAIGNIEVKNRFVHSATFESMATASGVVTEKILKRYERLARGGVGLLIPGALFVSQVGRVNRLQMGVHEDAMTPGLRKLVDTVHDNGSRIVFQVVHGGGQVSKKVTGKTPVAPSGGRRDPVYLTKPREMTEEEILQTVREFRSAAVRVAEAGADGIQIHAAHGILMNQFLSPFFNRRTDRWGGSEENRFRFADEVVGGIRDALGQDFPILVKLSSNDFTPEPGIVPELAAGYARRFVEAGVAAIEVSCGTGSYSNMNIWRGEVPVDDLVGGLPWWKKPVGWVMLKRMEGKYDLEGAYNLEAARRIKPSMGNASLILVGGIRRLDQAEEILDAGEAEFVSMSRPLIREPNLIRRFQEGKTSEATCVSCNKCLAATVNDLEVKCYYRPDKTRG